VFGVLCLAPTPQPPIPNPQSPIEINNKKFIKNEKREKKINIKFILIN